MSKFIPAKGDFFYVEFKPWNRTVGGFLSDTVEIVKEQDRSYRGDVFTCAGRDDHALVGTRKASYASTVTFVHDEVTYYPVGPEVIEALGLSSEEPQP
ncbi:hypothetical protein [Hydrogenophaga laconesensis]|uniref:DUF3850 domain-containing protein n=1 Tax=Hydrogenophaga laconesensis TaxID=1805971 RepID=A0ABU1V9V4_9BURK|nr:hypothetical protein [Hydrogenophaga laconesensis]MDR7094130.1 hypothetical protein [Hydrogenophaga laconesensis]